MGIIHFGQHFSALGQSKVCLTRLYSKKVFQNQLLTSHLLQVLSEKYLNEDVIVRRIFIYSCRRIAERVASVSDGLQKVRNFFDHEGASLSSEQEFIHFFALPFVADPQNHPSFKQLFQVFYLEKNNPNQFRIFLF